MTKTTDSRQLGMVFRAILAKYGAWDALVADGRDLQVEMDLVRAAKMYFAEVKQIGPAQVREKIFETMKLAAEKAEATDTMEGRITSALGVAANSSKWEDVIAFLLREDKKGRTIELFAKACEDDKFNMPKTHQIAMNPNLIMDVWPKVFSQQEKSNFEMPKDGSGFYA